MSDYNVEITAEEEEKIAEAVKAFMEANSKYEIKSSLKDTDAKVVVVVGDKERAIMKKSAQKIHQTISGSDFLTLPNYYHGDFSINHPQEYVDMLNKIVGDKKKNQMTKQ